MERHRLRYFLLICTTILYLPGIALGFESKFELGFATSRSAPDIDELSSGIMPDSSFDKTDQAIHLLISTPLTADLSLSIGYRDFGTTLQYKPKWPVLKQQSKAFDLQLDYTFYQRENLTLHTWAGIANWRSSLEQRMELQLYPSGSVGRTTKERTSGYTPKIGLGLSYRLSDHMSIGASYDYYRRLGSNREIIDRFKLRIGDLIGAATGQEPLEFSLSTFSISFGYRFN